MSLTPGTRLGPYEIVAPLGAGGMGEVYRARDTRLGREVAVKVLPQHLSAQPEVRARFEREAKTVSALNHPHICTLFDVGREGETDYLVMELVEGDTLAARLLKGPLTMPEVLRLGGQIADALDRAHKAGVIHRDLKPGNVMLTKTGSGSVTAKLMDFGLARATGLEKQAGLVGGAGSSLSGATMAALTQSPTVAQPLTAEGTLVGTFQYMSPEQLEGAEADARSDVWALGCVLYEMATGKRAFSGKSQASLISSIMTGELPAVSALVPTTPPAFERLLRACLAKEPDERAQTAHDVKLQLEWIRDAGSQAGAAPPMTTRRKSREPLAWGVAGLAVLAAAAAFLLPRARPSGGEPVCATIMPPPGMTLSPYWTRAVLSPDGRTVAFCAYDSTGGGLWVRPIGSETARLISDTRDASALFWSPDGRTVAYFSGDAEKLRKVALDGGSPVTVCAAKAGRGGAWNKDGVIVFSPAQEGPLLRVPANGGEPTPATTLDAARHETGHRFPCFLPDGDHFLFVSLPAGPQGVDTFVGSLKSKAVKKVLTAGSAAVFAAPGYLLYAREGRIMAQRFDAGRLELKGDAVAIGDAPEPSDTDAEPVVSVSEKGSLAALQSEPPRTRLEWLDRAGATTGRVRLPPGPWWVMRLSPDGRRATVVKGTEIWLVDLERAMPTRFALTASNEISLAWSPDGRRMAWVSKQGGRNEILVGAADGSGAPEVLPSTTDSWKYVSDWSPDGRYIVMGVVDPVTQGDFWLLPLFGDRKPQVYLKTDYHEANLRLSPDGRWAAFASTESGATEVYIQSFPTPGHKVRISSDGGQYPSWARGGAELQYWRGNTLMAVPLEAAGEEVHPGTPRALFTTTAVLTGTDNTSDGERFLASVAAEPPRPTVRLFLNWAGLLPR